MAREIIHAGLANQAFIQRATTGFEAYRASVEPYTLDFAERETGVPADVIRRGGARVRAGRPGGDLLDPRHHRAPQRRRQRPVADQPGAADRATSGSTAPGVNPLRGQNNVQGGGDMGAIPEPPGRIPGLDQGPGRPGEVRAGLGRHRSSPSTEGTSPRCSTPWSTESLHALYAIGENPAQAEADQHRTRPTADRARPPRGAGHLPHADRRVRPRGPARVLQLVRVGRHGHEQRAAGAAGAQGAGAARQRARRHAGSSPSSPSGWATTGDIPSAEDVWNEVRSLAPIFAGMSYERLEQRGRTALALLRRDAPRRAVPAQPALEGPGRGPPGAILGRRARPAGRATRRASIRSRSPPGAGWTPTTPACRPAATPRRFGGARSLDISPEDAERLGVSRRRSGAGHLAARKRCRAGADRPLAAGRARVHDAALPGRG